MVTVYLDGKQQGTSDDRFSAQTIVEDGELLEVPANKSLVAGCILIEGEGEIQFDGEVVLI